MGLTVCPAAIVAAPVEVVWKNLVEWDRFCEWADVQVEWSEPAGQASVGQTIQFAGKTFSSLLRFYFEVEEVNPDTHQFGVHAFFPFKLEERTHVSCTPIDASTCRVQYG